MIARRSSSESGVTQLYFTETAEISAPTAFLHPVSAEEVGGPSGAAFFDPNDINTHNISGWASRIEEAVADDKLREELLRALYKVYTVNLLAWRNQLDGKWRHFQAGNNLEGLDRAASKIEAERALTRSRSLGRTILAAYARSEGQRDSEGEVNEQHLVAYNFEFKLKYGQIGSEGHAVRSLLRREKGGVIAQALGLVLRTQQPSQP